MTATGAWILVPIISMAYSFNFSIDFARVQKRNSCSPSCIFNYSEVTSETIKHFPTNCTKTVCAILTFNENTDVTEEELKIVFQSISDISGGIRVINSNLRSLSFFNVENQMMFFGCEPTGILIANNSNLRTVDVFNKMMVWTQSNAIGCKYLVQNNPRLDASKLCNGQMNMRVEADGNLKDCGCYGDEIDGDTIQDYQSCTSLYQGMKIDNLTETELSALSNVDVIHTGDIEIKNTELTSLAFLQNIDRVSFNWFPNENIRVSMNIHDNYQLSRLEWSPEYSLLHSPIIFNIENVHPDFCLTGDEIIHFLATPASFTNLPAKFCPVITFTTPVDLRFCFSGDWEMETDCYYFYGDVKLRAGNEKHVDKFKSLTYVLGTITVKGTSITNLQDAFPSLQYIGSLRTNGPVISIIGNSRLVNASLPSIVNIITKSKRTILIHDNELLGSGKKYCETILNKGYAVKSNFIGGNCQENYTDTTTPLPSFDTWNPEFSQMIGESSRILTIVYMVGVVINIFHLSILKGLPEYRCLILLCLLDFLEAISGFLLFSPFWIRNEIPECYLTREKNDAQLVLYASICFHAIQRTSVWIIVLIGIRKMIIGKIWIIPVILSLARSWLETVGFIFEKFEVDFNCEKKRVYLPANRFSIVIKQELVAINFLNLLLDLVPFILLIISMALLMIQKKYYKKPLTIDFNLIISMLAASFFLGAPEQILKVFNWDSQLNFYRRLYEVSMILISLRSYLTIILCSGFSQSYRSRLLDLYDFTRYKIEMSRDHTMVIK